MKRKLLTLGIAIFSVALVTAIGYYAMFSATFGVIPSISIDGETEQDLGVVYSGETIYGEPIEISNLAPSLREIDISNDAPEGISVMYVSELTLSQKIVDFNLDVWDLLEEGDTAIVEYVIIGDEFNAEIVDGELEDYVLVYYKDNSDRFNEPATAIGIDSITGNLPYESDANADEYDYCNTEEYDTCHGAKIWYVPSSAVDGEGNVDWSQAEDVLFETELIQYNSEGHITIYPESGIVITPVYTIGNYTSGAFTITTTIA